MAIRDEIKQFLRAPNEFAASVPEGDRELWLSGLTEIADPAIGAHEPDRPLRAAQRRAWQGLADQRAGLILGPPGTGKTHALAWMAAGYVEACRRTEIPCRTFVTAFTRNAVANLLENISERFTSHLSASVPVYFLGSPPGPLPPGVEELGRPYKRNIDAIWEKTADPHVVVGGTVWGLYQLLKYAPQPPSDGFTAPLFRLVCLDEASQMVVAHGLMALAGLVPGGRVLVAGDDRQLPPIREDHTHRLDGPQLGGSLYTFLRECDIAEYRLDETFRLNEPLTRFPRRTFYDDQFYSVGPVQDRRLSMRAGWEADLESWERAVLDPNYPICVLVHDGPTAATANPFEAHLVTQLVRRLRERIEPADADDTDEGFWNHRLAVITPHRAQNAAIRDKLGDRRGETVVVETVDRIQGKERDAVIAGYTVSDPEFALVEADFIFSPQRLNVTVTRARSKFILIVARRLLDAVPSDQAQLDAAQILREFVFSATEVQTIDLPGPDGRLFPVVVRLGGFEDDAELPEIEQPTQPTAPDLPRMEEWHRQLLETIRRMANDSRYGSVADFVLARALAKQSKEVFADLITLHRHGHIKLVQRKGARGLFWVAVPLDSPRRLYPLDPDRLLFHLSEAIIEARRGPRPPFYSEVRDRFDCFAPDGTDRLWPLVEELHAKEKVVLAYQNQLPTIDIAEAEANASEQPPPEVQEPLKPEDFEVLNRLEELEARRINFGVFEDWFSKRALVLALRRSKKAIAASVRRLKLHGHVLETHDGRLRSRMAELAREVRYVKQRFREDDADRRPFLVRGLKVELRDRDKPRPKEPLSSVLARIKSDTNAGPQLSQALDAVGRALRTAWKQENPRLRGFQARALCEIVPAWIDLADHPQRNFVITADTGSGKTEAACVPLIIGALHDRLQGIKGTRAVLVYPRVRLAANQAQRLTGYLTHINKDLSLPQLTVGLQNGDVPKSFEDWERNPHKTWPRVSGPGGGYEFPFFRCPECDQQLSLQPAAGIEGADRLVCSAKDCGWDFKGWIGSKVGLKENPPALFLPTTESLHQWLNDPQYGALFGDLPGFAPPRGVLADEVHLFSHIHGAQIGYALRRLVARIEGNGDSCVAIGMSATLGDPSHVWGSLIGSDAIREIRVEEHEREPSLEGREYFFFVQPEVESRGRDIAGASATIQSVMVLAHGMRRRTGDDGGYRGIVFLDSIDKLKRLHHDYTDAEVNRKLARLRTQVYPDPGSGGVREGCCGDPIGCDCFAEGECWYFAATDRHQWTAKGPYRPGLPLTVADTPIWSGEGGAVERKIRGSDILFATSSLEVGYDDPDIALVYQHYAPINLASFIQRKGRAGRGADDRPLTGITLSAYSARDSWYFRKPHLLLDGRQFDVPLNMRNHAVVRGQAVTVVLDAVARYEANTGAPGIVESGELHPNVAASADSALRRIFGPDVYEALEVEGVDSLWAETRERASGRLHGPDIGAYKRRAAAPWVPRALFQTINLPELEIHRGDLGEDQDPPREDIALALSNLAPGNMTHRYGGRVMHWTLPREGRQPWLGLDEVSAAEPLDFGEPNAVIDLLPKEARDEIGRAENLHRYVLRPVRIGIQTGGRLQGDWAAHWAVENGEVREVQKDVRLSDSVKVHHKSSGQLRGFPVVQAQSERARSHPPGPLAGVVQHIDVHAGGVLTEKDSGLELSRLFWGADSEIRFCDPRAESHPISQVFTHPGTNETLLIGYRMTTEGIRVHLDSTRLDQFVAAEAERLRDRDSPDGNWYRLQMLRYIVQRRARSVGLNGYQAQRAAELIAAAAGDASLRPELIRLLRFWDRHRLTDLFVRSHREVLSQHPLITERRAQQVSEAAGTDAFRELLRRAMDGIQNTEHFQLYLRSLVVHSFAIRLKHAFVLHGRGDERRVVCHARLPVQFGGDADDIITVAENGEHGDGTTRLFEHRLSEALEHLAGGYLVECPNAAEDTLLARVFEMPEKHGEWRSLNPRDPETLYRLRADLGFPADDNEQSAPVHVLLRLLYGTEVIGAHEFAYYDLWRESKAVESTLREQFRRQPSTWELVSAIVKRAAEEDAATPTATGLLRSYESIDNAIQEDSLAAEARLADQIYRISGHLCVDGCQACVHNGSDIMDSGLAEATTSRRLLERFVAAAPMLSTTRTG